MHNQIVLTLNEETVKKSIIGLKNLLKDYKDKNDTKARYAVLDLMGDLTTHIYIRMDREKVLNKLSKENVDNG